MTESPHLDLGATILLIDYIGQPQPWVTKMSEPQIAMTKAKFLATAFREDLGGYGALGKARKAAGVPVMSPFHDSDYWYLLRPIQWIPDADDEGKFSTVTVPVGFVTDLASVPQVFWSILPPAARYTHAAIVHDYMYWVQTTERKMADDIFKLGMQDLSVPRLKAGTIYNAVRALGGNAWDSNAARKSNGEKRVLKRFPDDPTVSWEKWRSDDDVFD